MKRQTLLIAVLALAAAGCLVLIVWLLPSLLTRYPQVGGADRHAAIADTRTGLIALVVAIGAIGSLAYTARTYRITRSGHVADRYNKALEQLDHSRESVRIGGIFTFEQVGQESEEHRQTALRILNEYIRDRCPRGANDREEPASDVRIALRAIKLLQKNVLEQKARRFVLDFRQTNLAGADLSTMSLIDAQFGGADLRGAQLNGADLRGADLRGALLAGAQFYRADLRYALVEDRQLEPGQLDGVKNKPG